MSTFYEQIKNELSRIEQDISILEDKIASYPEGELFCNRDRSYVKWEIKHNHERKRLSKSKRAFAEQMAVKKYLVTKCTDLLQEKDAIQAYLKAHQSEKSPKLLMENSCYRELLQPHFQSVSDQVKQWVKEPYRSNPKYPEQLVYENMNGHKLRSKSELFIDTVLYLHHIPYRYECELELGLATFYPDFTICHPQSGKIYYYEHFGMMDNPQYAQKAYSKLSIYAEHGIVPTINLITTFETRQHPLTPDAIRKVLKDYLPLDVEL